MSKKNPTVSLLVTELNAAVDAWTPQRRKRAGRLAAEMFPADVEQMIEELTPLPSDEAGMQLVIAMRQAIKSGFILAVARYFRELRTNKEAMAIISARSRGGAVGREKSSQRSDDLAQRIRDKWAEMEAAGEKTTNDTVAAAMKCSRSTVIRAFKSTATKRTKR